MLAGALILASCADHAARNTPPRPASRPSASNETPERTVVRPGAVTTIGLEELFPLHQSGDLLLIDARQPFFYNLGHITGAVNLPRGSSAATIRKRDAEFRKAVASGKTIVTYCTGVTCPDARSVAEQISALGHPVRVFTQGWHIWRDAELPTDY